MKLSPYTPLHADEKHHEDKDASKNITGDDTFCVIISYFRLVAFPEQKVEVIDLLKV